MSTNGFVWIRVFDRTINWSFQALPLFLRIRNLLLDIPGELSTIMYKLGRFHFIHDWEIGISNQLRCSFVLLFESAVYGDVSILIIKYEFVLSIFSDCSCLLYIRFLIFLFLYQFHQFVLLLVDLNIQNLILSIETCALFDRFQCHLWTALARLLI